MRWLNVLIVSTLFIMAFAMRATPSLAQEPKRWISGDTLYWEIDSLMEFVPHHQDTALYRWEPMIEIGDGSVYYWIEGDSLSNKTPLNIEFEYKIPKWSVYRRSFRLWGISFSTGQPSPFAPFPAQNEQNPEVLSFPIPKPR